MPTSASPPKQPYGLRELYRARLKLTRRRQASHRDRLVELTGFLRAEKLRHPFQFEAKHYLKLNQLPFFQTVLGGPRARCPNEGYLYRITNPMAVAQHTDWRDPDTSPMHPVQKLWNRFVEEQDRHKGGWVPLRELAAGNLGGPRRFTWWTSLDSVMEDLIYAAYRLGLDADSIPVSALVLRVPVEILKDREDLRVPTVLEAIDQVIFHPTRESDSPPAGVTIDLNDPESLADGAEEYVVGPLPVEEIHAYPVLVHVDKSFAHRGSVAQSPRAPAHRRIELDDRLCMALRAYYHALA